ncbi:MAG TPA: hypothetical protein VL652_27110, partial [Kutzneria sp.]|nr:hypothetical protein [Kutzneria sp.]
MQERPDDGETLCVHDGLGGFLARDVHVDVVVGLGEALAGVPTQCGLVLPRPSVQFGGAELAQLGQRVVQQAGRDATGLMVG